MSEISGEFLTELENASVMQFKDNVVSGRPDEVKGAIYNPVLKLANKTNEEIDRVDIAIMLKLNADRVAKTDTENDNLATISMINTIIESKIADQFEKRFPVGSVYMTFASDVTAVTLKDNFGGTWERTSQGKVLVGVNENDDDFKTVGKTSGEKTHKLIESELARHVHKGKVWKDGTTLHTASRLPFTSSLCGAGWNDFSYDGMEELLEYAGSNKPHNNLQPYMTCYIWKRTA